MLFPIKKTVNIRGFTLIEMMVVVSIIIFLTSVIVPIYQGSRKQLALQRAANNLAQDIRKTEEMAMAVSQLGGSVPSGGYGVYFTTAVSGEYILFADCNNNRTYDASGTPCGGGLPEKIQDVVIEKEVQISGLLPASPLNIVFIPPDPTTFVNSSAVNGTIVLKADNSTTSVNVFPSGLIFIE